MYMYSNTVVLPFTDTSTSEQKMSSIIMLMGGVLSSEGYYNQSILIKWFMKGCPYHRGVLRSEML